MSFIVDDLVVLVADSYTDVSIDSILSNNNKLGTRKIRYKIYRHPQHDPGCFLRGHDFLRPFSSLYSYCLIIFDLEGCGAQNIQTTKIEELVKANLARNGWNDRAEVIVIDPELEVWIWSDSPHVDKHLGWSGCPEGLRGWLRNENFLELNEIKPQNPKTALLGALKKKRKSLSASIYRKIAEDVSFERCADSSFVKLKNILVAWFPDS